MRIPKQFQYHISVLHELTFVTLTYHPTKTKKKAAIVSNEAYESF